MDRRSFLKLGALLPAAKAVISDLFVVPRSYKDAVSWSDPVAYWPLDEQTEVANPYTFQDPMVVPSTTRIGEYEYLGDIPAHGGQHGFSGIDVQITTGFDEEPDVERYA